MKKYDNFCATFQNLHDIYDYEESYNNVVLTGLVALYEICFEQSWKLMKDRLTGYGYPEGVTGSPKTILKTAFQAGMIKDEELWLEALQTRNNVAHAYNADVALDIVKKTKAIFYDMFANLKKEIEDNWS